MWCTLVPSSQSGRTMLPGYPERYDGLLGQPGIRNSVMWSDRCQGWAAHVSAIDNCVSRPITAPGYRREP